MLFFSIPRRKYPVVSYSANRSEAPMYEILITIMLVNCDVEWKQSQHETAKAGEIQFHDNGHALNLFEPIFFPVFDDFFPMCPSLSSSSSSSLKMWVCESGFIFVLCIFFYRQYINVSDWKEFVVDWLKKLYDQYIIWRVFGFCLNECAKKLGFY